MSDQIGEEYQGSLTLPGEQEPRNVSLTLDADGQAVSIRFKEPVQGASEWNGSEVKVAQRLKYSEFVFLTKGLPKGSVELTWKFNASLLDSSLAGVIIARPNDLRIKGEKGFVLEKVA